MSFFTLTPEDYTGIQDQNLKYLKNVDALRRRQKAQYDLNKPFMPGTVPLTNAGLSMPTTRPVTPATTSPPPQTYSSKGWRSGDPNDPLAYAPPEAAQTTQAGQGQGQGQPPAGVLNIPHYTNPYAVTPEQQDLWDNTPVEANLAGTQYQGQPDHLVGAPGYGSKGSFDPVSGLPQISPKNSPARNFINQLAAKGATHSIRTRYRLEGFFDPITRLFMDDKDERQWSFFRDRAVDWLDSNAGQAYVNANPSKVATLYKKGGSVIDLFQQATGEKGPPPPKSAASAPPAPTPIVTTATTPQLSKADLRILASLVEEEAGNQSPEGRRAVAAVVLNRLKSGKFGGTLQDVLKQSGQFSPVWKKSVKGNLSKLKKPSQSTSAEVWRLVNDFDNMNPVGNALFFQNPKTSTAGISPALRPYFNSKGAIPNATIPTGSGIIQIGAHVFSPTWGAAASPPAGLNTTTASAPPPVQAAPPGSQPVTTASAPPSQVQPEVKVDEGSAAVTPTGTITSDNRGRQKKFDAGLKAKGGVETPVKDSTTTEKPKPFLAGHWTMDMFNKELRDGMNARREAIEMARFAYGAGDGEMYFKARMMVDNATHTLENLAIQKSINKFEIDGDPRQMMAIANKVSGKNMVIRPRSDGLYDIEEDGTPVAEGVKSSEIVSRARRNASQQYTSAVNAKASERVAARDDMYGKLLQENLKGMWAVKKEETAKRYDLKIHEGQAFLRYNNQLYYIGPQEGKNPITGDQETVYKSQLIKQLGMSRSPDTEGITSSTPGGGAKSALMSLWKAAGFK